MDPKTQGICLASKWIVRVVSGDEPWKILLRNRIALANRNNKWHNVGWLDKILLAPFFHLKGSFPLQSIWKAWRIVCSCLDWRRNSLQHGFSFANSFIWWNRLIQYQGQPLAVSFPKHAMYLFKKGVHGFNDVWDFNSLDWASWQATKNRFNLNDKIKGFFIFVRSLVPMELMMKLCTPLQCSVFKDWQWLGCFHFSCFPLKKSIYTFFHV